MSTQTLVIKTPIIGTLANRITDTVNTYGVILNGSKALEDLREVKNKYI